MKQSRDLFGSIEDRVTTGCLDIAVSRIARSSHRSIRFSFLAQSTHRKITTVSSQCPWCSFQYIIKYRGWPPEIGLFIHTRRCCEGFRSGSPRMGFAPVPLALAVRTAVSCSFGWCYRSTYVSRRRARSCTFFSNVFSDGKSFPGRSKHACPL